MEEVQAVFESVVEDPESAAKVSDQMLEELVADKGYHSNDVLRSQKEAGWRTYISEPDRGRRRWIGKDAEKKAVYANRRRIRGNRGRRLMRERGEKIEGTFAHCYETGGMRRTHLRGRQNIGKRLLIHAAGYNLGLLMRKLHGFGKPRSLQGLLPSLYGGLLALEHHLRRLLGYQAEVCRPSGYEEIKFGSDSVARSGL